MGSGPWKSFGESAERRSGITRDTRAKERAREGVVTNVEVARVLSLRDHVASVSTDLGFEASSLANVLKPVFYFDVSLPFTEGFVQFLFLKS